MAGKTVTKKNKMVANAVIFLLTADRDAVVPYLEEQDDNDSDESEVFVVLKTLVAPPTTRPNVV